MIVAGLVAKVVRVHDPIGPESLVDVIVTPPGGVATIQHRVGYGGALGWRTRSEVEAEALADAERIAAAGASPLAQLPVYDAPAVNDQVVVDHRPAMVIKTHRADPDTPIDAAVYGPDGTPVLRKAIEHGPTGWQHGREIQDRRAAVLAVDSGADFTPAVGHWVRVGLGSQPNAGGTIDVVPARGLILRIEHIDIPGRGNQLVQLVVRLFPAEPPSDPCIRDEPLPEGERVVLPLCVTRPESRDGLYRNEWESLGSDRIKAGSFHMTLLNQTVCGTCRERFPLAQMAGHLVFEPRGGSSRQPKRIEVCPTCVATIFPC